MLEERQVRRLGGTRDIEVKARIIAATHRDLEEMVRQGSFREDLLFRLNALTLAIPPLRERREEIVPLAERFIQRAGVSKTLSQPLIDWMMDYDWPGNVRELRNVVERAVYRWDDPETPIAHVQFAPFESPWKPSAHAPR